MGSHPGRMPQSHEIKTVVDTYLVTVTPRRRRGYTVTIRCEDQELTRTRFADLEVAATWGVGEAVGLHLLAEYEQTGKSFGGLAPMRVGLDIGTGVGFRTVTFGPVGAVA